MRASVFLWQDYKTSGHPTQYPGIVVDEGILMIVPLRFGEKDG
jgi:hypothetical protein